MKFNYIGFNQEELKIRRKDLIRAFKNETEFNKYINALIEKAYKNNKI